MFIKPCAGRITSPFGYRTHPITGKRQFHKGVDIAQAGTVGVHAAADGVVTRVGTLGTYGNVIMIVHKINGKTYETNYAHLRSGAKVIVGQSVSQGDLIAYMGNSGGSTGQHLHFEVHNGRWASGQPNAVDPMKHIGMPDIQEVQEKLVKLGYPLVIDGMKGPKTTAAIKEFQKSKSLAVDGLAGPITKAALTKAVATVTRRKTNSITIVGVKQAAFIVDTPSSKGKPLATIDLGKSIEINGSVPGWWEVKFEGRLAYVNAKFGRLNS